MTKGQAMRSKTKIFIKLTSFMLALVTLFCILPLTAFADEPIENVVSVNSEEVPTAEHYGYTNELVTGYTSTVGSSTKAYSYEYDARSNITSVSINGTEKFRYVYDDLNQLVREDNVDKNATFVYNYDTSGNILSVKAYPLTAEGVTPSGSYTLTSYGYSSDGWGDKLTSFNGQVITYDGIGNPLTYYNGSSYSFTWQGRQLVGATKGNKTMSFEYNADGIRTSKTVNGVETKYYLNGSQIVAEVNPNYSIMYIYDAEGSPIGMQYRASSYAENVFDYYFFEKNLQGDIVAVYGSNGTKYVEYSYDAWGNFTTTYYNGGASTGAAKNPFTYRGYYYDADLNLYYLNSRYYDQNTRRFVNADSYVSTGQGILGNNMYAYCGNNPVNGSDPTGQWTFSLNLVFFVGLGGGYSFNIGISVDSNSMVAFQYSYSVPKNDKTENTVIGATAGVGVGVQFTNLDSVSDLEGPSKSIGVNTPIFGADIIQNKYSGETIGAGVTVGPSAGGDFHVNFKSLVKKFLNWLGF